MPQDKVGAGTLAVGGIAAMLASACCLGPLVLLTLGVSGAWIANLTLLEPLQPWFLGAAVVALFFAYRRIFRPAADCKPGEICAAPSTRRVYKVTFWVVAALAVAGFGFPYVAPLFY